MNSSKFPARRGTRGRSGRPDGPITSGLSVMEEILCSGGVPMECRRRAAPGKKGAPHFISFSTKMTITTAAMRTTIKPPYIRKFMNFFPKVIFSFFSALVSWAGVAGVSILPSFFVSDQLFTYYNLISLSRKKCSQEAREFKGVF
jgi:hypothetical protein